MPKTKTPIADASDEQLRAFLIDQQIEGAETAQDRPALTSLLTAVWGLDYIMVDAPEPAADGQTASAGEPDAKTIPGASAYADDPIAEIMIGESTLAGGKHPAMPSVNGRTLVCQRNMWLQCPWRFYLALRDAKQVVINPDMSETTVYPYPLQVRRLPSDAEIAAWFERTKDAVAA